MPLTQLILMLEINSWMQCKVPQIKLKVLQPKLRFKVRQFKVLQTTMFKLLKIEQLAPAHPVPNGPVMPAPQVFYQNWVGKKPEFSGKPEEDVESHLLSTRDWMEAHRFPA